MTGVVVPREGPLSWRPSKGLRERLVAEAARREMPLGRLIEELCLAGLSEEAEPWRPVSLTAARKVLLAQPAEALEQTFVLRNASPAPAEELMAETLAESEPAALEVAKQALKAAEAKVAAKPRDECRRAHYHRDGRYCTTCGKSY